MTDKELRRLSRAELIDLLFELQTQNEALAAQNQEFAAQLENRQLEMREAGSIAEAALRVNGVFEAAQAAADQYLLCAKESLAVAERKLAAAKRRADEIVQEAQAQAQKLLDTANARLDSSWSQFLLDDTKNTENGE